MNTHEVLQDFIGHLVGSDSRYLEVGVRDGDSLRIARDSGKFSLCVGVDTWGCAAGGTSRGNADYAWNTLCDRRVLLITGDSHSVLPGLRGFFDLIYIDGDHTEIGCLFDLTHALPLLAGNGTILVDDLKHPYHLYLFDAVKHWAACNGMTFDFIESAAGVGLLRRL